MLICVISNGDVGPSASMPGREGGVMDGAHDHVTGNRVCDMMSQKVLENLGMIRATEMAYFIMSQLVTFTNLSGLCYMHQ